MSKSEVSLICGDLAPLVDTFYRAREGFLGYDHPLRYRQNAQLTTSLSTMDGHPFSVGESRFLGPKVTRITVLSVIHPSPRFRGAGA